MFHAVEKTRWRLQCWKITGAREIQEGERSKVWSCESGRDTRHHAATRLQLHRESLHPSPVPAMTWDCGQGLLWHRKKPNGAVSCTVLDLCLPGHSGSSTVSSWLLLILNFLYQNWEGQAQPSKKLWLLLCGVSRKAPRMTVMFSFPQSSHSFTGL